MSKEELSQAFDLMKQGNKSEAIAIVRGVLQDDMENINAWLLMANLLDDDRKKKKALERVLRLNPEHPTALKMMQKIDSGYNVSGGQTQSNQTPEKQKAKPVNYDWSKLEKREKEGFKPPEDKGVGSVIRSYGNRLIRRVALIGILIVLSSIWGFWKTAIPNIRLEDVNGNTPDDVVLAYTEASSLEDFDTMRTLTCPEYLHSVDEIEQEIIDLYGAPIEGLVVDMSQVTTERVRLQMNVATVALHGDVILTFEGESAVYNFDDDAHESGYDWIWEHTKRVNGVWMVCDGPDEIYVDG